jgi:hypothetical protein
MYHLDASTGDLSGIDRTASADDSPNAHDASSAPSRPQGSCRFSKLARSILRTWFHEHKDNPYPTNEEKRELATKTGLKASQIALWLVNTRRRYRSKRQQTSGISTMGQTISSSQRLLDDNQEGIIARLHLQKPFQELNPMDRWKVTPMEQEPAALPVILATVAAAPEPNFDPYLVHYRASLGHFPSDLQSGTCLSSHYDSSWARSRASYETGMPSLISGSSISDNTSFSNPMLNYAQSANAARDIPKDRRRRRGNVNKSAKPDSKERLFQCTFCSDCTFATKHDWQRHEKSQHLTLESWTCCLSGGTIQTHHGPACVFCHHLHPDTQHMETHNYSACQEKDPKERTFYRKDHFQQHLRLTHESKFHSRMEAWKAEVPHVLSRCGFCSATFTTWSARADHLAAHFKCRATMKDWVGDWGLEPHIAALVECVIPRPVEAHPQLTMPSMPPPPLPCNAFQNIRMVGDLDHPQLLQKHTIGNDMLRDVQITDFALDPSAVPPGLQDLNNVDVFDWVDFGVQ